MTALVDRIEAEVREALPGDALDWEVGLAIVVRVLAEADPTIRELRIITPPDDFSWVSSPSDDARGGMEGICASSLPPYSLSDPMPEWEVRWLAVRSMEVFLPHTSCWFPVTRGGAVTLEERHGWRSRPRNKSPRELRAAALLESEGGGSGGGGMFANAETEIEGVG